MSKRTTMLAALGLLVAVLVCGSAWSRGGEEDRDSLHKEVRVSLSQVPKAARRVILREAGEHKIREVERIVAYEAEWVVDGKEVEVVVSAEGELLGRKTERADDDDEGHDDDDD